MRNYLQFIDFFALTTSSIPTLMPESANVTICICNKQNRRPKQYTIFNIHSFPFHSNSRKKIPRDVQVVERNNKFLPVPISHPNKGFCIHGCREMPSERTDQSSNFWNYIVLHHFLFIPIFHSIPSQVSASRIVR